MRYEDMKDSLEDVWRGHQGKCDRCSQFDKEKPATLALVCLEGAPFIKQILEKDARKLASKTTRALNKQFRESEEGKYIVSKDRLREVMRYKQ